MSSRELRNLFVRFERNFTFFEIIIEIIKYKIAWQLALWFFRDVEFGMTEMNAANIQTFQFSARAFKVIRFPVVFSKTLHETTDRYVKLRNDRHYSNHYHIIIHKSFNYSNTQSDILYLYFVSGTTNEL
jgi:hypothetical protein